MMTDQPSIMSAMNVLSCRIPGEMVVEILSRLPIKSLVRFKCVSKSWRELILDRSFALMNYNLDKKIDGLMVINSISETRVLSCAQQSMYQISEEDYHVITGRNGIPNIDHHAYCFVGCCNGLICLCFKNYIGSNMHYALLNPALREYMPLPKLEVQHRGSKYCTFATVVYGFDTRSKEYKVVDVQYFEASGQIFSVTHVYDMSKNAWREIHALAECMVVEQRSNAFVNGFIHWISSRKNKNNFVVTFDIINEVFRRLELPADFRDPTASRPIKQGLHTWNGRLAIARYYKMEDESMTRFDIWVMMEYGVAESWTHQEFATISYNGFMSLVAIKNSGEQYDDYRRSMSLLDPVCKKWSWINIRDPQVNAVNYEESMVSPMAKDYVMKIDYAEIIRGLIIMFVLLLIVIYFLYKLISGLFV